MSGKEKADEKNAKKKTKKKNLVIVESPSKAKTIEKYLGPDYIVRASMGHLIDLPKSKLGVNIENNFEPEYITIRGSGKVLSELKSYAKKADAIYLASDNDREGEAIAYHLRNAIRDKTTAPITRVVFNEITPDVIRASIQNPREIDENKVNAQKARRVLDRIIGYKISPVLWEKVKNGLSAGRVQSVALRMICEREKEVTDFIPVEYWSLDAKLKKNKTEFLAYLLNYRNKKVEMLSKDEITSISDAIKGKEGTVCDLKTNTKTLKPKPPFTTSTLQQAAATRLGFTSRKTMQIAQQLYEGVQVGASPVGLITYMRTDSVRISDVAISAAREFIGKNFPDCLPEKPLGYVVAGKAQDAHEAIRPTYIEYTPEYLKENLTRDQLRLYTLIWERFVACQMTNAKTETTSYDIAIGDALFRASSTAVVEKGFQNVFKEKDEKAGKAIPKMKVGDVLTVSDLISEQHFTQGPARYTDASIVKALEENGIGRPSTYAPTISVLLDRYYVTRENKQLVPTQLGKIINGLLVDNFDDVVNVDFTAKMETMLDNVETNQENWQDVLKGFYPHFQDEVDAVMQSVESIKGSFDEKTDMVCEKCGRPMVKKLGRYGFFLACEGFPECRNAKSIPLAKCPKPGCNGDIVAKRGKGGRGRQFYGCTNYPDCDFITYFKPIEATCPKCGWFMVEKYDKKNGSYKACINPECDYLHSDDEKK